MKTEKNLVWLVWQGRNFFPRVQEETPEGVTVDLAKRKWTFRDQTIEFGHAVQEPWDGGDGVHTPLGVFDRTKIGNLRLLTHAFNRFAALP